MKFEWELIHETYTRDIGGSNTHRAKVFGGWIVSSDVYTDAVHDAMGKRKQDRNLSQSTVFISDPNHEWIID